MSLIYLFNPEKYNAMSLPELSGEAEKRGINAYKIKVVRGVDDGSTPKADIINEIVRHDKTEIAFWVAIISLALSVIGLIV